jgi:beta-ribofuranosylaminobenzene 5'-phosphate synthase
MTNGFPNEHARQGGRILIDRVKQLDQMPSKPDGARVALYERLLAAPGGGVTSVLEEYLGAPVRATKIEQASRVLSRELSELEAQAGTPVIDRRVVLLAPGQQAPLLYAAATILPGRLPESVVQDLLGTDVPIGKLLERHRLPVGSRCHSTWEEPATPWRALLPSLCTNDVVIRRSYQLLVDRELAISISETIPAR